MPPTLHHHAWSRSATGTVGFQRQVEGLAHVLCHAPLVPLLRPLLEIAEVDRSSRVGRHDQAHLHAHGVVGLGAAGDERPGRKVEHVAGLHAAVLEPVGGLRREEGLHALGRHVPELVLHLRERDEAGLGVAAVQRGPVHHHGAGSHDDVPAAVHVQAERSQERVLGLRALRAAGDAPQRQPEGARQLMPLVVSFLEAVELEPQGLQEGRDALHKGREQLLLVGREQTAAELGRGGHTQVPLEVGGLLLDELHGLLGQQLVDEGRDRTLAEDEGLAGAPVLELGDVVRRGHPAHWLDAGVLGQRHREEGSLLDVRVLEPLLALVLVVARLLLPVLRSLLGSQGLPLADRAQGRLELGVRRLAGTHDVDK
eukprot:3783545-Lingulodinium_polyedra.AAC.1